PGPPVGGRGVPEMDPGSLFIRCGVVRRGTAPFGTPALVRARPGRRGPKRCPRGKPHSRATTEPRTRPGTGGSGPLASGGGNRRGGPAALRSPRTHAAEQLARPVPQQGNRCLHWEKVEGYAASGPPRARGSTFADNLKPAHATLPF